MFDCFFIGKGHFTSKKGNPCYYVDFAVYNNIEAGGQYRSTERQYIDEASYNACTLSIGDAVTLHAYIDKFGKPCMGII